jgi:hypothetical protein
MLQVAGANRVDTQQWWNAPQLEAADGPQLKAADGRPHLEAHDSGPRHEADAGRQPEAGDEATHLADRRRP